MALLAFTVVGSGALVVQQLSPKPNKVSEPPPLVEAPLPEEPAPEPPPVEPVPPPTAHVDPPPQDVPRPPAAKVIAVDKIPRNDLGTALMEETNPDRKIAIIKRLETSGLPFAPFAVAVLFPDPDKRVRLEALRAVEAIDKENRVLMPKVHAVYMYEHDPEVKAVLDRLVQKFRPQEEAEYKARQAQVQAQANVP